MTPITVVLVFTILIAFASSSSESISCNFNDNLCSYQQSEQYGGSWNVNQDAIEITAGNGSLRSPAVSLSGPYCISLDYYLLASEAFLNIYAQRVPRQESDFRREQYYPLFTRNEKSSFIDQWQHYEKTLNFTEFNYEIFVSGYVSTSCQGLVSMRNFDFREGSCLETNSHEKVCDFDGLNSLIISDHVCDWFTTMVTGRGWDWQSRWELRDGFRDHSTASEFGGYLFGTSSGSQHHQLLIRFDQFNPNDGRQCLTFWIQHVLSQYQWEVVETAVDTNVSNVLLAPHRRTFASDNRWRRHQVNIDPVVPIVVELRIHPESALVHLDSFKIEKGSCPPPATCDFQDGICGFARDYRFDSDISIRNISNTSNPDNDEKPRALMFDFWRTPAEGVGDGFGDEISQLMFEAEGPNSILTSEIIIEPGSYCFSVIYDVIGSRARFEVSKNEIRDSVRLTCTTVTLDNNSTLRECDVGKSTLPFYLQLEITGRNTSSLQIRSTKLRKGNCGTIIRPRTFVDVNFHCYSTGHYIPQYRTCDGVIDCPMGEDEGDHCSSGHECGDGGIPCTRRGHKFCLSDLEQFCDGVKNCDDEGDEDPRMCNAESFCDNYCLNDGECDHSNFKCTCESNHVGKRCT